MGCLFSLIPILIDANNNNINTKPDLSNYNINNTDEFSLNNLFIDVRVVSIYDGDTCTCILPLFNNFYKFILINGSWLIPVAPNFNSSVILVYQIKCYIYFLIII